MDTKAAYEARFLQLRARFLRECGTWDWAQFVTWLIKLRSSLRPASYRQYRAAVLQALEQHGDPKADELANRLRVEGQAARRHELPLRTSAGKAKSLPDRDWTLLLQWFGSHPGRWNELTAAWLCWGPLVGLRPVEWRDVVVDDRGGEITLRVHNAKHSHGRAHGPMRTVHIRLIAAHSKALQDFVQAVQRRPFDIAYQGCRQALYRAARALWPNRKRRPTLYSGRHQFSADAKASGLRPEEIAAIMGHAVTATHQEHYGKRRSGRGRLPAMPDAEDVARVHERMAEQRRLQRPMEHRSR